MKYKLCAVPSCSGWVTEVGKKVDLCNKHFDMLMFFMWALENVKFPDKEDKKKTKSGLILP